MTLPTRSVLRFAALAAATFLLAACSSSEAARVSNVEAPVNLQAEPLTCFPPPRATPDMTPPALYSATRSCMKANRVVEAAQLFALAGAYSRFDTLRVQDRTAHQASTALKVLLSSQLSEQQRTALGEQVKLNMATPEAIALTCRTVAAVGKPTYSPIYMIQHGMASFAGVNGHWEVEGFDPSKAWDETLTGYLHCPAE